MTLRSVPTRLDTELRNAEGDYHGSVSTSWPLPDDVRLLDNYLLFDREGGRSPVRYATASMTRSLLPEFVRLRNGSTDQIVVFAAKYGALGLCGHGLPKYHTNRRETSERSLDACMFPSAGYEADAESIVDWILYASRAAELLELSLRPFEALDILEQGALWTVNGWLRLAFIHPRLARSNGQFAVELGNGTLFGAIVVQLMYVIAGGGTGLVCCAGCRTWFSPKRRPATGKRSFCESKDCKMEAQRFASYDYRTRNQGNPERPRLDRGRRVAARSGTSNKAAIPRSSN
jgi:hypothetical protein